MNIYERITSTVLVFVIATGLAINTHSNYGFDNTWTVGEWLISYEAGFVRRGLWGTVIYTTAKCFNISPLSLVLSLSIAAYLSLCGWVLYWCRQTLSLTYALSPFMLAGPIIGNYIVRKDCLLLALFGTCLWLLSSQRLAKWDKVARAALLNLVIAIAILSHESFFFWGLPPIIFAMIIIETRDSPRPAEYATVKRLLKYSGLLLPCIVIFTLTAFYKGSESIAAEIHSSWRSFPELLTNSQFLGLSEPQGAIRAVGWSTEKGISHTLSLFQEWDRGIWVPAAWLLTLFIANGLFTGNPKGSILSGTKRFAFLLQTLCMSPLFVLGIDYGRWIFLICCSSAMLHGMLIRTSPALTNQLSQKLVPPVIKRTFLSIYIDGRKALAILFIALPPVSWSIHNYFALTPLNYVRYVIKQLWFSS